MITHTTAVCLIAFLPGFFQIPPVDRDEARFAQATKQMVESGDYGRDSGAPSASSCGAKA